MHHVPFFFFKLTIIIFLFFCYLLLTTAVVTIYMFSIGGRGDNLYYPFLPIFSFEVVKLCRLKV